MARLAEGLRLGVGMGQQAEGVGALRCRDAAAVHCSVLPTRTEPPFFQYLYTCTLEAAGRGGRSEETRGLTTGRE